MAKNEAETQYDPYAKEPKDGQPSIRDLLNHQKRIDANIRGETLPEDEEEEETIVPENMTVAELKAALDEANVEYSSDDKKADLVQLYSDYLADNQDQ